MSAALSVSSQPGRGQIVAGGILLAVSLVGGMVAFTVLVGRFDVASLRRDVVVLGDRSPSVPGEIRFRVDRSLRDTRGDTMAVAVAVEAQGTPLRCSIATSDGVAVTLTAPPYGGSLLNGSSYTPVSVADLRPGTYTASCRTTGEPSTLPRPTRFTVGRTLGDDDVSRLMGPLLGIVLVAVAAAILFVLGLVLLIVGLVRRSRDGRDAGGPQHRSSGTLTWQRVTTTDEPPASSRATTVSPPATPLPQAQPGTSEPPPPPTPPRPGPVVADGQVSEWTVPERYRPDPPAPSQATPTRAEPPDPPSWPTPPGRGPA